MSYRIGRIAVIEPEPPARCELCGLVDELRPYGPGGKKICFDCADKDREGTERRMKQILFGGKTK